MKQIGNCFGKGGRCPFFFFGRHSGFTGMSGPITWSQCSLHKTYVRKMIQCRFAGNFIAAREKYIEMQRRKK